MIVTRLVLKNWRNFCEVDVPLRDRTYLLGANASGKSNLLDVFRFLRDVSKPQGGGLQKAIYDREGIQKLRFLRARRDPEVSIEVHVAQGADDDEPLWRYKLGFKPEGKGAQRTLISAEQVWRGNEKILDRPDANDKKDAVRLTQTALEQIQGNVAFRELATFFGETTYLHLVPQLLKYGDKIGGQRLEDDPFGQGLLERIAKTTEKTREARLKKIAQHWHWLSRSSSSCALSRMRSTAGRTWKPCTRTIVLMRGGREKSSFPTERCAYSLCYGSCKKETHCFCWKNRSSRSMMR